MMADRAGARPRVLRPDRSFAAAHDRQRAVAGTAASATRRHRRVARAVRSDADPHRHRGRHPRGRRARPGARTARATRHRRRQRALEARDGARRDDPTDGARGVRVVKPTYSGIAPAGWSRETGASRPESKFDAEKVFTACRDHGTAVEINSRPERRDPPTRLLKLALEIGCDFSIDTDAHAPGQLDFLGYGAQRALDNGVPVERIINTWSAEKLLAWTLATLNAQSGSIGISRPGSRPSSTPRMTAALPNRCRTSSTAASRAVRSCRRRERQLQLLRRRRGRCWTPRNPPASGRVRRSAARPRPPGRGRRPGWRRWTPWRAAWCATGWPG